jgi:hypothetical protein
MLTAFEVSNDDVQNTSSLGAQIAAAFLIVFAVERRRAVHPLPVRDGILMTYIALPFLITGTLAPGFVARIALSLGLGALADALLALCWVGLRGLDLGAAEQEADARLRYRLVGFLDRHR